MAYPNGCRARIRTWAKGFKVPRATTTQLGILAGIIAFSYVRGNTILLTTAYHYTYHFGTSRALTVSYL